MEKKLAGGDCSASFLEREGGRVSVAEGMMSLAVALQLGFVNRYGKR